MDKHRVSNISNLYLNHSTISQDSVKSNLESRIEMERSQVNLIEVLKIMVVVVSIFFVIFTFKFLLDKKTVTDQCRTQDNFGNYIKRLRYQIFGGINPDTCKNTVDIREEVTTTGKINVITEKNTCFEEVKEDKSDSNTIDNSIWNYIQIPFFGYDEYKKHYSNLKNQKFSVSSQNITQPKIEYTSIDSNLIYTQPEFKDFKTNDSFDNSVSELSQMINNVGKLEENTQSGDLETLLSKDNIFELQLKANDLANSTKNLISKKKELEKIKSAIQLKKEDLDKCPSLLSSFYTELESSRDKIDQLTVEEKKLADLIKESEAKIKNIREQSQNSSALLKIADLEQDTKSLKAKLVSFAKIEKEISSRRLIIAELQSKKVLLDSEVFSFETQISENDNKISDLISQKNSYLAQIKLKEKSKAIMQMKFEFASRNKYIKDFLMEMIKDKSNVSEELKIIFDEQMSAEDHIKQKLKNIVDENSDSQLVFTEQDMNDLINQDQKGISEINDLYIKLVHTIKQYKDTEIDIEKTKQTILTFESEITILLKKIQGIENQINEIQRTISKITSLKLKTVSSIDEINKKIKSHEDYIEQNSFDPSTINIQIDSNNKEITNLKENHQVI
mgnify:FL=1